MRGLNIVLFWFDDDWGQFGRTYERIAENMAEIDSIRHVTVVFPPIRSSRRGLLGSVWLRKVNDKLSLATEVSKKPSRIKWLGWAEEKLETLLSGRALARHLRSRGYSRDNTLLWLFPPHPYLDVVRHVVPHCGVIGQVVDDFTKFDKTHKLYSFAVAQYPTVSQWASLIFTTSKANHAKFGSNGKPCFMFEPAVDEIFIADPSELPWRAKNQHPHLGYVGWIMDRTDLDLVAFVARTRPDWDISLVGPEYPQGIIAKSGLTDLPNVSYRGPLAQSAVPAYLQELDVCLMPHRDNEYSRSMGPLKLYQYLASGRPIVCTKVAGLENLGEHVHVASDYADFIAGAESALVDDDPSKAMARVTIARSHTWKVRTRQMLDVIQREIPEIANLS